MTERSPSFSSVELSLLGRTNFYLRDSSIMSLNDRLRARCSPDPVPGVLSRSKSFAGLLSHRRSVSAGGAFGGSSTDGSSISSLGSSSGSSTLSRGGTVLGQSYSPSTTRRLLQGFTATWSGKAPRTPRPERTLTMFQSIGRALRECISLTKHDIANLKSSVESLSVHSTQSQGRLYEYEKQLKAAERYLKRLEFQVAKLEELYDNYEVQQKMRDGVRTMAYAFVLSPGKEKETALHSVRSGLRECTDTLCAIETELECMMGTLLFQMKGIQGYARLCAGDVFEITVRHGDQKWKSKGRVLKNEKQAWDNQQVVFKALLGEVLCIKAVELRTLGKNVLLGNKYCETKDLFSAHPQVMTVNLNPSGSLKLSLVVTWNPLHGFKEEPSVAASKSVPPLLALLGSPLSKPRNQPPPPIQEDAYYNHSPPPGGMTSSVSTGSSLHRTPMNSPETDGRRVYHHHQHNNNASVSAPCSAVASPDVDASSSADAFPMSQRQRHHQQRSREDTPPLLPHSSSHQVELKQVETTVSQRWSGVQSGNSSDCCSVDLGNSSEGSHLADDHLQDVLQNIVSCLEDIQGQYPELHALEQHVAELDRILWKGTRSRRGSSSSNISLSVESALGCFDFLNTAVDGDDADSVDEKMTVFEDQTMDPEMTAKTSDSGVANVARQLLNGNNNNNETSSSPGPSPQPTSCGFEQLDLVIVTHLSYCQRLIENLGAFGPLKCKEVYSLDKLRRQISALDTILQLVKAAREEKRCPPGVSLLPAEGEQRRLWELLTEGGDPLCATAEQLLPSLNPIVYSCLGAKSLDYSSRVARQLVSRIVDSTPRFDPDSVVTVLQFKLYFGRVEHGFKQHIREIADEISLSDCLSSESSSLVLDTLQSLKKTLPCGEPLYHILTLLLSSTAKLAKAAEAYLKDITRSSSNARKELLTRCLEGLEVDDPITRQASCAALALLRATECTDQLVYLSYADESEAVRQQAKDALFSFGEEGRRAFEQSQLFSHGFGGLSVK